MMIFLRKENLNPATKPYSEVQRIYTGATDYIAQNDKTDLE